MIDNGAVVQGYMNVDYDDCGQRIEWSEKVF